MLLRSWDHVSFADELRQLLPADLPFREECIAGAARHLDLIVEANQHFNLTRIVNPREAAIKHVVDSVLPWRLFQGRRPRCRRRVGRRIPRYPARPGAAGDALHAARIHAEEGALPGIGGAGTELANVEVRAERAEEWLNTHRVAIVIARAVAPLNRAACALCARAARRRARPLLKGPDAATEIAEAAPETAKRQLRLRIIERYELPDALGARTIVEMKRVRSGVSRPDTESRTYITMGHQ